MKVPVFALDGSQKGEVSLGRAFSFPVRTDLIRRAFRAESLAKRQVYGTDPLAGKRTSAHYHGKRHYRWTMMNREMARMKRIHSQGFLNYTARFVPQATKGRKAHPPKVTKTWKIKINKKERMAAFLSCLSATVHKDYVTFSKGLPLVVEDQIQTIKKTKDMIALFKKLGITPVVKRTIRAGKGTRRGRKYRTRRGPLIISSKPLPTPPGMETKSLRELGVVDLAPGGRPGRLCIWTQSALEEANAL